MVELYGMSFSFPVWRAAMGLNVFPGLVTSGTREGRGEGTHSPMEQILEKGAWRLTRRSSRSLHTWGLLPFPAAMVRLVVLQ